MNFETENEKQLWILCQEQAGVIKQLENLIKQKDGTIKRLMKMVEKFETLAKANV